MQVECVQAEGAQLVLVLNESLLKHPHLTESSSALLNNNPAQSGEYSCRPKPQHVAIASPAFNSPWAAGENSYSCLGNDLSWKGKSSISLPITDPHSPAPLPVSTDSGAAVAQEGAEERMEGAAPVWCPQLLNCLWSFSGKVMGSKFSA